MKYYAKICQATLRCRQKRTNNLLDAIGDATAQLTRILKVHCIFALTVSGYTARMLSADRPAAPIMAMTHSETIARRMQLLWGAYPQVVEESINQQDYLSFGERIIKNKNLAKTGDFIIMISGIKDIGSKATSIIVYKLG